MIVIAILAATFAVGAIGGVFVLACVCIAREESSSSLLDTPPTRAAAATRRMVGMRGQRTMP